MTVTKFLVPLVLILAVILSLKLAGVLGRPEVAPPPAADQTATEPPPAEETAIRVDDDLQNCPDADFTKIQDAVDAASAGDTIVVYPGFYSENINVSKDHLTIRAQSGTEGTIVQPASPSDILEVKGDYVNISGLTLKGVESHSAYAAIRLKEARYCNVTHNDCSNSYFGIVLSSSNKCRVESNVCHSNGFAIFLGSCSNCNVTNNNCSNNTSGIQVQSSSGCIIASNACNSNFGSDGICLHDSVDNTVQNNECRSNGHVGITIYCSDSNVVAHNECSSSLTGIDVYDSSDNTIANNNLTHNDTGIRFFESSSANTIYLNNFIDYRYNSYGQDSRNTWNSPDEITYMYSGNIYTNYLGNHWDDYTGSDVDRDGIGDSPYSMEAGSDSYPLRMPVKNYEIRH